MSSQHFTVGSHVAVDIREHPVHATTDPIESVRPLALTRLHELKVALEARGFTVDVNEDLLSLTAKHEAEPAEPDEPGPVAPATGTVALVQRVQLAMKDNELTWYWEWTGQTRDAPADVQPLCPAAAIAEATERISRVLAIAQ